MNLDVEAARSTVRRVRYGARLARGTRSDRDKLRREAFFEVAKRFTPFVVADWPNGQFLLSTNDRVMGRLSFTEEPSEVDALNALRTRIPAITGRSYTMEGRTIIEVGANIGTATVRLIRSHGAARVVAVEPAPFNADLLAVNLALNGLVDRVDIRRVGLSDRAGTMEMETSPSNSGDYRLRVAPDTPPPPDQQDEDRFGRIEVTVTTFDELVAGMDLDDVGLVWLDTQGHEGHVLAGAKSLLERDIPIVTEYWPYGLRRAGGLELFEQEVTKHFDVVYDLEAQEPVPVADLRRLRHRYAVHNQYTNLILVKTVSRTP